MFASVRNAVVIAFISIVVAGCSAKGSAFEGHWHAGTSEAPYTLDIRYSKGLYHVDQSYKTIFSDEAYNTKFEATPLSDEVLEVQDEGGTTSMRLENGHLYFDDQEYTKS